MYKYNLLRRHSSSTENELANSIWCCEFLNGDEEFGCYFLTNSIFIILVAKVEIMIYVFPFKSCEHRKGNRRSVPSSDLNFSTKCLLMERSQELLQRHSLKTWKRQDKNKRFKLWTKAKGKKLLSKRRIKEKFSIAKGALNDFVDKSIDKTKKATNSFSTSVSRAQSRDNLSVSSKRSGIHSLPRGLLRHVVYHFEN